MSRYEHEWEQFAANVRQCRHCGATAPYWPRGNNPGECPSRLRAALDRALAELAAARIWDDAQRELGSAASNVEPAKTLLDLRPVGGA